MVVQRWNPFTEVDRMLHFTAPPRCPAALLSGCCRVWGRLRVVRIRHKR